MGAMSRQSPAKRKKYSFLVLMHVTIRIKEFYLNFNQ